MLGCTEKHLIEPTITDDVSWTPDMTVINVGYQRVEMELKENPSDQIVRNLSALTIEALKAGESQYVMIDSLNTLQFVLSTYTSAPALEENTDYQVRFSAVYKNGIVKKGNAVAIHSPDVKGTVLKQIAHPQPVPGVSYGGPTDFTFWQGNMFVLFGSTLVRIDTSTGNWTVLTSAIVEGNHDQLQMTFVQDTLIIVSHGIANDEPMTISWINAHTLGVMRSAGIYPGERPYIVDLTNDGSSLLMLVQHSGINTARFLTADIQTGETISELPDPLTVYKIAVNNGDLWTASSNTYNNRIHKVNPGDFSVLEDYQNPVFLIYEFAWDGDHFWVFDYEQQTYSKLQIEGL